MTLLFGTPAIFNQLIQYAKLRKVSSLHFPRFESFRLPALRSIRRPSRESRAFSEWCCTTATVSRNAPYDRPNAAGNTSHRHVDWPAISRELKSSLSEATARGTCG